MFFAVVALLFACSPAPENLVLKAAFVLDPHAKTTGEVESMGLDHGENVVTMTASRSVDRC